MRSDVIDNIIIPIGCLSQTRKDNGGIAINKCRKIKTAPKRYQLMQQRIKVIDLQVPILFLNGFD